MEFKQIYKVLFIAVMLIGGIYTASAKTSANNIVYNTQERNGLLVEQTLYKQEGKTLIHYLKYSYVYNNQNRIVENNIEKWDSENQKWTNGLTTKYSYEGQNVITKTYKWNTTKREYQLMPSKTKTFKDYSL